MIEPESYFTENKLCPFIGVVEDTADPLQIGRVRVRAIGYHPEKNSGGVPTEHLPWAYVVLPTTAAGMSGVGATHGLIDGSWVFGWFLDGRDAQQPIIIGTFTGAPGFTPAQRSVIGRGGAIASGGPGGVGGMFQTALASVVGGLGSATKFGATVGTALNLIDALKNDDFFGVITQVSQLFNPVGSTPVKPPVARVIDAALIGSGAGSSLGSPSAEAISGLPGLVSGLIGAGGGGGGFAGGGGPLSSASFGTAAPPGAEPTANTATVAAMVDYGALVDGMDSVGAVMIGSTGTDKLSKYTVGEMLKTEPGIGAFDYLIDQTGQVIKTGSGSGFSVAGEPTGSVRIGLVGGGGSGPIDSKFYPIQFQTLEKLTGAVVRKYPRATVAAAPGGSPAGFDPVAWASVRFPQNANVQDGVQRLAGVVGGSMVANTISSQNLTTRPLEGSGGGSVSGGGVSRPTTGLDRGFQGGPSHPFPAYAAIRASDVPALARTNGLSGGLGVSSAEALAGGPGQQYLAKLEEPTMWTYKFARPADTLEARSVPKTWKVPVYPHGGEYNKTHVVRSTEAGHHIVLDDTPGREKVEIMHASGSALMLHADGSGVFYIKKDGYEVVLGDKKIGVNGSLVMSVGGDMKVQVQGDLSYDVTGKISFNGATSMTELIRGDRKTITEGNHMFHAKQNMVLKAGRSLDMSSGKNTSIRTRGNRHDVVDGNFTETTHGELNTFVGGNHSELVMGTLSTHASFVVTQSTSDIMSVAKSNQFLSAFDSAYLIAGDDMSVSGAGVTMFAFDNLNLTGGSMELYSATTIKKHPDLVDGATSGTGYGPLSVEASPSELTKEAIVAASDGNLDSELPTKGGIDKLEYTDDKGLGGGGDGGTLGAGGGTKTSDPAFTPVSSGEAVPASGLGDFKGNACGIANELVAKGWSPEGASAIVGNMINESSLNPSAWTPDVNGLGSGGLIQWNGPRLAALQNWSSSNGLNWRSQEAQIGFLDYEARTSHSGYGGAGMIGATSLEEAIRHSANYERFVGWNNGGFTGGAWENGNGNRAGNAAGVYNECFGHSVTSVGGVGAADVGGFTGPGTGPSANTGADYSSGLSHSGTPGDVKEPYATGGSIDWGRKVSEHFTLGQMCPTSKFHEGMNETGSGWLSSGSTEKMPSRITGSWKK